MVENQSELKGTRSFLGDFNPFKKKGGLFLSFNTEQEEDHLPLSWKDNSLRDFVHTIMERYEDLRYHRNRPHLVRQVKLRFPKASYESITRCQRLIWADGQCHPIEEKELRTWHKLRKKGRER